MVRHGILIPAFVGSNPTSPTRYQHLQITIKADTDSGQEFRFVNLYHIGLAAREMWLIVVIAHTSGCVAIVLFSEVIAYSRKLYYALLYCGVPVNQVESPSALMGVESAGFA